MTEEERIECWMLGCEETFPDNGRGREGRKIHWEYQHAGLESQESISRVEKNAGKKFSIVDIYREEAAEEG